MLRTRAALLATACLLPVFFSCAASSQSTPGARPPRPTRQHPLPPQPTGDRIADITVVGNRRIEAATVESYMLLSPGQGFDPKLIDQSLKTLYATGLFSNV